MRSIGCGSPSSRSAGSSPMRRTSFARRSRCCAPRRSGRSIASAAPNEYKDALTVGRRAALRMQDIVERLLALVRADVAPDVQEPAPVAMRTLIDDVVAWLAPMAQERGVRLSVSRRAVHGERRRRAAARSAEQCHRQRDSLQQARRQRDDLHAANPAGRRRSKSSTRASAFPPKPCRACSIGSFASTRRDRARWEAPVSGSRLRAPSSSRTAATSRARASRASARCSSFRSQRLTPRPALCVLLRHSDEAIHPPLSFVAHRPSTPLASACAQTCPGDVARPRALSKGHHLRKR